MPDGNFLALGRHLPVTRPTFDACARERMSERQTPDKHTEARFNCHISFEVELLSPLY